MIMNEDRTIPEAGAGANALPGAVIENPAPAADTAPVDYDMAMGILMEALSDEPAPPAETPPELPGEPAPPPTELPPNEPAVPPAPAAAPVSADTGAENPLDYTPISEAIKSGFESVKQGLAPAEPPAPEAEPPAPETPALPDTENFLEQFGGDPVKAVMAVASIVIKKEIDEYKQRTEQELAPMRRAAETEARKDAAKNALIGFFTNPAYPDAQDMGEDIINVIKQDKLPQDDPLSFERAYNKVKIGRLSQNKPLDAYLSDEESLAKLIADPRISKPLIDRYLQGVAGGEKPSVIAQTGLPPAAPPKVPDSIDEAGKMLAERFA
jgi:hypothetical protein